MAKEVPIKYRREIIKMRNAGMPDSEIAAKLGIKKSTLWVYACLLGKQFDSKFPAKIKWDMERLELLAKAVSTKSYKEAGKEFGINGPRVSHLMKKYTQMWTEKDRMKS